LRQRKRKRNDDAPARVHAEPALWPDAVQRDGPRAPSARERVPSREPNAHVPISSSDPSCFANAAART
jgi:hypothetical protein